MSTPALATIEAELSVPIATAQLVRFDMPGPSDNIFHDKDAYWLDLCLTPRPDNCRARYRDRWGPHRFERVGPVFMLPRGESLQFKSDEGGSQMSIICQLRPEPISDLIEHRLEWTDRRLQASLDISSANIRGLLRRLGQELRYPGFASKMMTELIAGQIAIELGRYCSAIDDAPATGGLASWRLRMIEERLTEIREAPTLSELAALCNMSVRQLTRGFRASRGCSIGDYITQSRIDTAKRLLANDESIKAIAGSMGFASASSFSYAFRRGAGVTPRQFRTRVLRNSR
ncbi:helix-turn-helix transcriptional regulator [Phenylobacterium sp. LjRoot225]|uniref:helix-turn-helix domain-containing protein n=1 Tax=Phenylobacterium sp. LjRoot225 TaxID=3342285 RepID=UPI003ECC76CE